MAATEPDMKEPGDNPPHPVDGLASAQTAVQQTDRLSRANEPAVSSQPEPANVTATTATKSKRGTRDLAIRLGTATSSKLKALFKKSEQLHPGEITSPPNGGNGNNGASRLEEGTSTKLKELQQADLLSIAAEPSPASQPNPPLTLEETRAAITKIKMRITGQALPALNIASEPSPERSPAGTSNANLTPSTPEETRAAISNIKKRKKPDMLMRLGETTNTNLQDLIEGAEFFGSIIPPDSRSRQSGFNHSSASSKVIDQSRPRQTVDQSGPRQTVEQSGPRQAVEQSGPRQTVEQSGPRQAIDQSGPRQTVDQSGPRQAIDQRLRDQSGPRKTVDHSGPRQAIDQRLRDQSGPRKTVDQSGPIALPASTEPAELAKLGSKAENAKFNTRKSPSMLMRLGDATNTRLKNLLQGADFFGSILSDSSASSQATDQNGFKALADSITQSAELDNLVSQAAGQKPRLSRRSKASLLVRLGEATNEKLQALFHNAESPEHTVTESVELDSRLQVQTRKAIARDFGTQKSRAVLQAPWLMLLLTALVVISLTKLSTIEMRRVVSLKTQAAMPKNFTGMRFASTDQKSQCKFLSSDQCDTDTPSGRQKVKYSLISGQPDLSTFLLGYLRRHELWYHYNASGLVASDGNVLYNPNAPELAIVKKMTWYADFANRCYRESKLYPNDAAKCKHSNANYVYINPFTHLTDYAAIVVPQQQANPDLIVSKSNQQQWRPGAIFCTCVVRKKFFIQGCDGDGRALTSSVPGKYYTIACEDGITLTEKAQSPGLNHATSPETNSANRLFIYQNAELDASVQWERGLCQLLLWSAFSMAGLWCCSIHKATGSRGEAKFVSIGATILSLIALATWYICALMG